MTQNVRIHVVEAGKVSEPRQRCVRLSNQIVILQREDRRFVAKAQQISSVVVPRATEFLYFRLGKIDAVTDGVRLCRLQTIFQLAIDNDETGPWQTCAHEP